MWTHSKDHAMVYNAIKENVPWRPANGWDTPVFSMLNGTDEIQEMTYRIFKENKVEGD